MLIASLLTDFQAHCSEQAEGLEEYAPPAAVAWRKAGKALEMFLADYEADDLTLDAAARESGYSERHLRRLIKDGQLPATEDGRVLRRDLPRKPGYRTALERSDLVSPADLADIVVNGGGAKKKRRRKS